MTLPTNLKNEAEKEADAINEKTFSSLTEVERKVTHRITFDVELASEVYKDHFMKGVQWLYNYLVDDSAMIALRIENEALKEDYNRLKNISSKHEIGVEVLNKALGDAEDKEIELRQTIAKLKQDSDFDHEEYKKHRNQMQSENAALSAERGKLLDKVDDLKSQIKSIQARANDVAKQNQSLSCRITDLTSALEFYAEKKHYQDHSLNISVPGNSKRTCTIEDDAGRTAHQALKETK